MKIRFEFDARWATRIVVAFGVLVAVIFALHVEGCEGDQRQANCRVHLSRLVQAYRNTVAEDRFDPTLHGSAQILSWLAAPTEREEIVYFCPDDPVRRPPKTSDERRDFHPADDDALRHAAGLGSYAVRDFEKYPVAPGEQNAWILCDRQGDDGRTWHHQDGLMVAFSSGVVRFLTRAELHVGKSADVIVGPTSAHPELRKMERP